MFRHPAADSKKVGKVHDASQSLRLVLFRPSNATDCVICDTSVDRVRDKGSTQISTVCEARLRHQVQYLLIRCPCLARDVKKHHSATQLSHHVPRTTGQWRTSAQPAKQVVAGVAATAMAAAVTGEA